MWLSLKTQKHGRIYIKTGFPLSVVKGPVWLKQRKLFLSLSGGKRRTQGRMSVMPRIWLLAQRQLSFLSSKVIFPSDEVSENYQRL